MIAVPAERLGVPVDRNRAQPRLGATTADVRVCEERLGRGLDVYRVTKGSLVIGEYAGRRIGSRVFRAALKHTDPGRSVCAEG